MKILIYGEYSGYGKSLAKGFKSIGHEANVFSPTGDGWKKIDSELVLNSKTKVGKLVQLIQLIPKFLSYDLVFIMNPEFFSFKLLGPIVLSLLKLRRIKIVLLCCGDDVEYIKAGESGLLKNYMFKNEDLPKKKYYSSCEDRLINYLCAKASIKIIPTMYDYYLPWKFSKFKNKVTDVIPLACDFEPVKIKDIKKTNPRAIRILHGINRRDVKGSKYILSALERIRLEFDNVEVVTPERLSQKEYLDLFSTIDISIDQCKCHSYGMNAIYSMFHGHVVMAPADIHHCETFKITSSPVISITANEEHVYAEVKKLIINVMNLDLIKVETLKYATKYHSPSKVCNAIFSVIKV